MPLSQERSQDFLKQWLWNQPKHKQHVKIQACQMVPVLLRERKTGNAKSSEQNSINQAATETQKSK